MATKRKHNSCSLQLKLEVLNRLDKGETVTKLASEYGVGKATISDWKKIGLKLKNFVREQQVQRKTGSHQNCRNMINLMKNYLSGFLKNARKVFL